MLRRVVNRTRCLNLAIVTIPLLTLDAIQSMILPRDEFLDFHKRFFVLEIHFPSNR